MNGELFKALLIAICYFIFWGITSIAVGFFTMLFFHNSLDFEKFVVNNRKRYSIYCGIISFILIFLYAHTSFIAASE